MAAKQETSTTAGNQDSVQFWKDPSQRKQRWECWKHFHMTFFYCCSKCMEWQLTSSNVSRYHKNDFSWFSDRRVKWWREASTQMHRITILESSTGRYPLRGCEYRPAEHFLHLFICSHISGAAGDGQQQSPGAEVKQLPLGPRGFHYPGNRLDGLVELHSVHVLFI